MDTRHNYSASRISRPRILCIMDKRHNYCLSWMPDMNIDCESWKTSTNIVCLQDSSHKYYAEDGLQAIHFLNSMGKVGYPGN